MLLDLDEKLWNDLEKTGKWTLLAKTRPFASENRKDMEPFPSLLDFVNFANLTYYDDKDINLPNGWKLLASVDGKHGYHGLAFCNEFQQQVVIAHRGTHSLHSWMTNIFGVILNYTTSHICSAVTFTELVKRKVLNANKSKGISYNVSITGHSLGGWLGQITAMTVKYLTIIKNGSNAVDEIKFKMLDKEDLKKGLHAHTVLFDSPGAENILIKIKRKYLPQPDGFVHLDQLDIKNYIIAANPVNLVNYHHGEIFQLSTTDEELNRVLLNLSDKIIASHKLDNFLKVIKNNHHKGMERQASLVTNLPKVSVVVKKIIAADKSPDSNTPEDAAESNVPIYSENDDENSARLSIFSQAELKFVQICSYNKERQMTEIYTFLRDNDMEDVYCYLSDFEIKENIITCKTKDILDNLIKYVKLLLRWYSVELKTAIEKEISKDSALLLRIFSETFIGSLPNIVDCADTIGLQNFLLSKDRVFLIDTENSKFEASRLNNLICHLDKSLDEYTNKIFLNWNDVKEIEDNFKIAEMKFPNLLVFDSAEEANNGSMDLELVKKILSNLEKNECNKLVILSRNIRGIKDWLQNNTNISVGEVARKDFGLNDLTQTSREELLNREVVAFRDDRKVSLNKVLGRVNLDVKVSDEVDLLIRPIVKFLATDRNYSIDIKNMLPALTDIDALNSKVYIELSLESLVANISRILFQVKQHPEIPTPLFLLSGLRKLGPRRRAALNDSLKEFENYIIRAKEEDGPRLFKEVCLKNSNCIVYWIEVTTKSLCLRQLYNEKFYVDKRIYNRVLVDFIKLIETKTPPASIVFQNSKEDLTNVLKLSTNQKKKLFKHDSFYFKVPVKEKHKYENKHFLKLDGEQLVWEHSEGSLDSIRPFLYLDLQNPKCEKALGIPAKARIIADQPGAGKSSCLTKTTHDLTGEAWVLRVDLKQFETSQLLREEDDVNHDAVVDFLLLADSDKKGHFHYKLTRNLLKYCLNTEKAMLVYVLVDGFDEIKEDSYKIGVKRFLKYLRVSTTARITVTTRICHKVILENDLSVYAMEFEKFNDQEQIQFLILFWDTHLKLQLDTYGEEEKKRLEQYANRLYSSVKQMFSVDPSANKEFGDRFIGMPLQMTMMAGGFLEQAKNFVQFKEPYEEHSDLKNIYNFFNNFVSVKYNIYLENKTILSSDITTFMKSIIKRGVTEKHYLVSFQTIEPKFSEKHLTPTTPKIDLEGLDRYGLVILRDINNVDFIHSSFSYYFCADFFWRWLNGSYWKYKNLHNILKPFASIFLLKSDHKQVRIFLDAQLEQKPLKDDLLQKTSDKIVLLWQRNCTLLLNDEKQTPLHVAADEGNVQIVKLLLGENNTTIRKTNKKKTSKIKQSERKLISLIAARDAAGETAINIALRKGFKHIFTQIMRSVEDCSPDLKVKLFLNVILQGKCFDLKYYEKIGDAYLNGSVTSMETAEALLRVKALADQVEKFVKAVRNDNEEVVTKIFNEMPNDVERYFLPLAVDSHGDTAMNLVARRGDFNILKLFMNQDLLRPKSKSKTTPMHQEFLDSKDINNKTPLHRAAEGGHVELVKLLVGRRLRSRIDSEDNEEMTPLSYALQGKSKKVVSLLRKRTAYVKSPYKLSWSSGRQLFRAAIVIIIIFLCFSGRYI